MSSSLTDFTDLPPLLRKLSQSSSFDHWNIQEKRTILEVYKLFCSKEALLFRMIYEYHSCDSYEDLFRDFNETDLEDKTQGVQIAINNMNAYDKK